MALRQWRPGSAPGGSRGSRQYFSSRSRRHFPPTHDGSKLELKIVIDETILGEFMKARFVLLTAALLASGCSSIIEGTTQTLSFESNPSGADCGLTRNEESIGSVHTPGGILIKKTKYDIHVLCAKNGYQSATAFLKSHRFRIRCRQQVHRAHDRNPRPSRVGWHRPHGCCVGDN